MENTPILNAIVLLLPYTQEFAEYLFYDKIESGENLPIKSAIGARIGHISEGSSHPLTAARPGGAPGGPRAQGQRELCDILIVAVPGPALGAYYTRSISLLLLALCDHCVGVRSVRVQSTKTAPRGEPGRGLSRAPHHPEGSGCRIPGRGNTVIMGYLHEQLRYYNCSFTPERIGYYTWNNHRIYCARDAPRDEANHAEHKRPGSAGPGCAGPCNRTEGRYTEHRDYQDPTAEALSDDDKETDQRPG